MNKEKCIFYENGECKIYACSCDYAESCKENTDCIIKRLQQENERLAKELKAYEMSFTANLDRSISKRYEELLDENERLKEESKNYCIQLQVLAQALEDIRDISNKHDYWRGSLQSATNIINDILDKINSTIGVEE